MNDYSMFLSRNPGRHRITEGVVHVTVLWPEFANFGAANTGPGMIYCPFPRRLMILLYDSVILLALLLLASAAALPFGGENLRAFQDPWFTLWLFGVCFAYLATCWRAAGMTLGMRAWKVRLVTEDGRGISWPLCLLRFCVGLISVALFGLGVLWALLDKKNRTWHDLAARTVMIKPLAGSE